MKTILIDGRPHDVCHEGRVLHGYIDVFVKPAGVAGGPHACHGLPVAWKDTLKNHKISGGGHLYEKDSRA